MILELSAVAFGVAYLVLAMRQSVWCWPAAIVQVALSFVVFLDARLVMEAGLQVFYLAMALYGWHLWLRGGELGAGVRVHWWPLRAHALTIAAIALLTMLFGRLIDQTSAAMPYVDSFTTVAAVFATWMVALKVIENWIYWFVIDAVSIWLYLDRELYFYVALFAVYLVLIVIGFRAWLLDERRMVMAGGANAGDMAQATDAVDAAGRRVVSAVARFVGSVDAIAPVDSVSAGASRDGGTGGRSFVVSVAGRRFHAKAVPPDSGRLLALEEEYGLLTRLAPSHLTPEPVGCDIAGRVLVTAWLEGFRPIPDTELRSAAGIGVVAQSLRELHAQPVDLVERAATEIVDSYVAALGSRENLTAADRSLADECRELAGWLDDAPLPRVLCHGDLVPSNILVGSGIRFVDFEYARVAPAIVDLASLSVMNEFGRDVDAALLAAYFGGASGAGARAAFPQQDFAKVRRLTALQAHLWARLQVANGLGGQGFLLVPGTTNN